MKPKALVLTFKLNNVKYLFHWIDVQDILFQLIYQYISKTKQKILFEFY